MSCTWYSLFMSAAVNIPKFEGRMLGLPFVLQEQICNIVSSIARKQISMIFDMCMFLGHGESVLFHWDFRILFLGPSRKLKSNHQSYFVLRSSYSSSNLAERSEPLSYFLIKHILQPQNKLNWRNFSPQNYLLIQPHNSACAITPLLLVAAQNISLFI